jgi:hypothetical protein
MMYCFVFSQAKPLVVVRMFGVALHVVAMDREDSIVQGSLTTLTEVRVGMVLLVQLLHKLNKEVVVDHAVQATLDHASLVTCSSMTSLKILLLELLLQPLIML